MSRPRTSAKVLELRGSLDNHPGRRRDPEPIPAGPIGEAPDSLPQSAVEIWDELVANAAPGVLTVSDRVLLELTVGLLYEYRTSFQDFPAARMGHLMKGLSQLGMTPADRNKIGVPTARPKNRFGDF